MNTDGLRLGFSYLRLSDEESLDRESESIDNQRMIVTRYCEQHGITLVREFVDDGWSGGNFVRPWAGSGALSRKRPRRWSVLSAAFR